MQDNGFGIDTVTMTVGMGVSEHAKWKPKWTIEKYDGNMKLYDTEEIDGNLLLSEGITSLFTLLIGGSEPPFSNANAHVGVGDGTDDAIDTQVGLLGTNKSYAPMDSTFPNVSGKVVTFRSTFGPDKGNHAWREFTVANGISDSAKNLNRKVESVPREKFSPDTWVVQLQITIT